VKPAIALSPTKLFAAGIAIVLLDRDVPEFPKRSKFDLVAIDNLMAAIAGFDDVRYATLLAVPLSTMHQPCRDLARIATKMVMDRVANPALPPQQVLLEAKLVSRASTT
jgi:hypothetical protein